MKGPNNPEIKRLLGTEGDIGSMLGVEGLGVQRDQIRW